VPGAQQAGHLLFAQGRIEPLALAQPARERPQPLAPGQREDRAAGGTFVGGISERIASLIPAAFRSWAMRLAP
jgi:hypothetical protein